VNTALGNIRLRSSPHTAPQQQACSALPRQALTVCCKRWHDRSLDARRSAAPSAADRWAGRSGARRQSRRCPNVGLTAHRVPADLPLARTPDQSRLIDHAIVDCAMARASIFARHERTLSWPTLAWILMWASAPCSIPSRHLAGRL
jgi:hypothetical protein